ncbi:MAG: Urea carboxylase-related aminomethyltransferase [Jatrophihabitans sp.]|nr:Urea carboxylase-related aminomethyltransferase [Jatrophihabitans sp.]
MEFPTVASALDPDDATVDVTVDSGDGFAGIVPAGASVRIVDLFGNQDVDTLFYDAQNLDNR